MGLRMRNLQPTSIRPVDADFVTAEEQQVKVDFARTPAPALLSAKRLLDLLKGSEQSQGASVGVGTGRHVQRNDGVQEVGLILDPDGPGSIQA